MTTAFVAWRAPTTRTWYPVGRLRSIDSSYEFVYTASAERARKEAGFQPLASFPDLDVRYISDDLFPLFANRLLAKSRRDYPAFVEWLSLPDDEADPVALIARSGGHRATDALEIFQCPERDATGLVRMHFFAHGLQHFSPQTIERAARLKAGEPLLLLHDFQNSYDPSALMLRTAEEVPGDIYPVGYCPRYLLPDVFELLKRSQTSVRVSVLRVNPPPAPIGFRLLCRLTAAWPAGYQPFSGAEYQPLSTNPRTAYIPAMRSRSRDTDGSWRQRARSPSTRAELSGNAAGESTLRGWVIANDETLVEVPEHLVRQESILWPRQTMPEKSPAAQVEYFSPSDLYVRHEVLPGRAYVFVKGGRDPHTIPKRVIDELRRRVEG
jgi:hypothetical protein